MTRRLWLAGAATVALFGQQQPQQAGLEGALTRISADSLRGNVSFLASDVLEGRATPSRGQDVAAEFLAAQFRRAGLEPIGPDGSYFQEARFVEATPKLDDFSLTMVAEGQELKLGADVASVRSLAAVDVKDATVVVLPEKGDLPALEGKVVAGAARVYGTEAGLLRLQARKPALIVLVSRRAGRPAATFLEEADSGNAPVVRVGNEDAANALAADKGLTLSVHASAPAKKEFTLRNVGGVVRGSDPALRDEFVMLTAHYDHIGMRPVSGDARPGDRIFNGANDNASGTASVVEIAGAVASLPTHPKRSILFMTLFGEERGLLGAYYYARHPLYPLAKTVAVVNLEQMGRTDDKDGARLRTMSFTGHAYSDLPDRMAEAAKTADVSVYRKSNGDAFFPRSDNYAFALAGVVSHTLVVTYDYPEYHGVGDEWPKLDFANMAVVDRGITAGVVGLANDATGPRWAEIPETAIYRK